MSFHRLTVPAYSGGLRLGDDYINNATAGTPAPADTVLAAGTYTGSYFFIDGQVTAAGVNRGLNALAENCDLLDDSIMGMAADITALEAQDVIHTDDIAQLVLDMGALTVGAITDANTYSDTANAALLASITATIDAHKANLTRARALTTNGNLHSPDQDALILVNTAGGDFNLQLPAASDEAAKYPVILFNEDGAMTSTTNRVTLVRVGGETINGLAANYVLGAAYGRWILRSDGTNWVVV